VDNELDALMPDVPAIAIEGPRAVGKTETASTRARTTFRLDDPAVLALLEARPGRIADSPWPVLIDEWQLLPSMWDVVRRAVDVDLTGGRFMLTGSAAPSNAPTHTGAGRIVSLRMRPMTLLERGVGVPTVSLADLLTGRRGEVSGETDIGLERYAHEVVVSGFPGLQGLSERAIRAQLGGYVDRVVDRDFRELGGRVIRNQVGLRRWLSAYASAVSSTSSYEKIRDAATAGHADKPAKPTVIHWIDTLERLWMVEPVPAWSPQRNDLSRLARSPKHQFFDPALAANLRGVTVGALLGGADAGPLGLRDGTLFGALFESLATLQVRVFAQAAEAGVSHFRTRNGDHEVDLIVERTDRRVVAIEVKGAQVVGDKDVEQLRWLSARIGTDLLDAVVITTGPFAYRRRDGIAVVPLALLGV